MAIRKDGKFYKNDADLKAGIEIVKKETETVPAPTKEVVPTEVIKKGERGKVLGSITVTVRKDDLFDVDFEGAVSSAHLLLAKRFIRKAFREYAKSRRIADEKARELK